MAAATNDLNKIIKDTAIQLPQYLQLVDQVVKVLDKAGSYDTKKMKANIKNFKKVMAVIEDYNQAVTEMIDKLGKQSMKGKIVDMVKTLITKDPTEVTGKEKNPYESGFELFDKTANVIYTIQKILDGMIDLTTGQKGSFLTSARKFKKVRRLFLLAVDMVFEVIEAVCAKIQKIQMNVVKKFDFEAFEKFTGFFDQLHKMLKKLLILTPLMILAILASPIMLIGLAVFTLVLNGIFFILNFITPKSLDNARQGINDITKVFGYLAIVILELIILSLAMPYAVNAVIGVLIGLTKLSLCLIAIFAIIWLTNEVITKLHVLENVVIMVRVILALDVLILEFLVMAILLWALQAIAKKINWGEVIKFMIITLVIIVIFALLGFIALKCVAYILPGLYALFVIVGAITIIVGLILLMAAFLWLLQYIKLDQEKIKENVKNVITTALYVIKCIFTPTDEEEDADGKPWYKKLLSMIGRGVMLYIEAILAVRFISMIFIAIAFILLIAVSLRLLQTLDLDPNKITENVHIVIDTAMMVVNLILYGKAENPEDDEGKPWYKKLFEFVGGQIVKIIEVILAIHLLAMVLIAITLVLIIAGELRLLQMLDLNPSKITENVRIVIDTAHMVIDAIFSPDDGETKESKKGFFEVFLNILGGYAMLLKAIMSVMFLAHIIVAILLIMFIAKTLQYIQDLELDPDKIKTNVDIVIDTARFVISSIFDSTDDKDEDPSSKGFFRTLLEVLGLGSLLQILDAVMAIAYLALIMVSIYIIKNIAETLEYIANLQLDEGAIKKNVQSVIRAAKCVIDCVFQKDNTKPEEGKGVFRKLLKMILPSRSLEFLDAIMAIGYLSLVKTCVGLVGEMATNLAAINNLPNMSGVKDKVQVVTDTSRSIINAVLYGGRPGRREMESLADQAERAEDYLRAVQKVPSAINKIIDGFNGLKELRPEDKVGSLRNIFKSITEFNQTITDENIQKSATLLRNYDTFLTRIDTLKIENLQTAVRMFEEMSRFSESISGNFDALAETLNERIAPLMEELKNTLDGVKEQISEKSQPGKGDLMSYEQTEDSMLKKNSKVFVGMDDTQKDIAIKSEMEKETKSRYGMDEIDQKLSELIDLFREGTAKVKLKHV